MEAIPIRILIVEDSEDDMVLVMHELRRGGYEPFFERVERAESMAASLGKGHWDLVIANYVLPSFSGLEALRVLQRTGEDLPFIIVSGTIGEETAVEAMKAGAHDYIMKNNLKRLIPAVERELKEAKIRRERRQMENELKKRVNELEEFYNIAIGRELRMKELKDQIESLKEELERCKSGEKL